MVKVEIATDINTRWEEGMEHDERSIEMYKFIEQYDFKFCGDALCLSSGGDGDNGEHLMYLMDEFFANKDKQNV